MLVVVYGVPAEPEIAEGEVLSSEILERRCLISLAAMALKRPGADFMGPGFNDDDVGVSFPMDAVNLPLEHFIAVNVHGVNFRQATPEKLNRLANALIDLMIQRFGKLFPGWRLEVDIVGSGVVRSIKM